MGCKSYSEAISYRAARSEVTDRRSRSLFAHVKNFCHAIGFCAIAAVTVLCAIRSHGCFVLGRSRAAMNDFPGQSPLVQKCEEESDVSLLLSCERFG